MGRGQRESERVCVGWGGASTRGEVCCVWGVGSGGGEERNGAGEWGAAGEGVTGDGVSMSLSVCVGWECACVGGAPRVKMAGFSPRPPS